MPGDDAPSSNTAGPSFEDVVDAYFDCRRRKRNSTEQLAFEIDLEHNLYTLWQDLVAGTYRIGPSQAFVVTHPKVREIWAASFRDRVVHHVIYNAASERFIRRFITDCYACLPGRGTLYARDRVARAARSLTQGWSRDGFYLKLDIANFFNSIDHDILERLVLARIHQPWIRDLVRAVIRHDPRPGAVVRSSPELFAAVPRHKSYLHAPPGKGLPIGNLTSQFFANVYLDGLDQLVKHTLRPRFYGRYVDDFLMMAETADELLHHKTRIEHDLATHRALRLHPHKIVLNRIAHGINFVGYIIKPGRTYLRRSTLAACHRKIDAWEAAGRPIDKAALTFIAQSANSTLGMLRHVDGYGQRRAICARFDSLFAHPDPGLTRIEVSG